MVKQVQAVEENHGLIAQAKAEYEAIVEEARDYYQKAREMRGQADKLKHSGSTDPQVATQVMTLLEQANYFDQLANQKDGHPRLEAIRRLEDLQREAFELKGTIQYNESVLAQQQKELEEVRKEAVAMIRRVEERIQKTEQLLASCYLAN